jgi:hypothetical protein
MRLYEKSNKIIFLSFFFFLSSFFLCEETIVKKKKESKCVKWWKVVSCHMYILFFLQCFFLKQCHCYSFTRKAAKCRLMNIHCDLHANSHWHGWEFQSRAEISGKKYRECWTLDLNALRSFHKNEYFLYNKLKNKC